MTEKSKKELKGYFNVTRPILCYTIYSNKLRGDAPNTSRRCVMSEQNEVVKCEVCGKTLTKEQSQAQGIGHRCETLLEQGWTGEKLQAHYAELTVNAVPEGYIKVAELHRVIDRKKSDVAGLTVSKMVKAIGRDRALEGPIHPIAKPVYDQRKHRWVNPWLATKDGLTAIATGDFSKAPKS